MILLGFVLCHSLAAFVPQRSQIRQAAAALPAVMESQSHRGRKGPLEIIELPTLLKLFPIGIYPGVTGS